MQFEDHFERFRRDIVGIDRQIPNPFGESNPLLYVDWTASGRGFRPVERRMGEFLENYGNSHSEDSHVGRCSTHAYEAARASIKRHVNASENDALLFIGSGATGAINWFQRMLGLKDLQVQQDRRPVVIITDMEHHSNHTSWEVTAAEVIILSPTPKGLPDLDQLQTLCKQYQDTKRPLYGSFTACSNVTGVITDYHKMASIVHENGGFCFIDFAAGAPYMNIDMHPADPLESLDAIFFSPHKFLGGPGSSGVVVFDARLYTPRDPVNVGGGIVKWTNPYHQFRFLDDIEHREDAGTPAILQSVRAASAVEVKEQMIVEKIEARKKVLLETAIDRLSKIENLKILEEHNHNRSGIISFVVNGLPYGLVVTLLSDLFGVQARGGCSCAGTYGHRLFGISRNESQKITDLIDRGDNSQKPGWVRISLHPTMTDHELDRVLTSIESVVEDGHKFMRFYNYSAGTNAWVYK